MKECSSCGYKAEFGFVCLCDECEEVESKQHDKIVAQMNKQEKLLLEIYKTIDKEKYSKIIKKIESLKIHQS